MLIFANGRRHDVTVARQLKRDTVNERQVVLLTNHLDFGATTIAAIYKDRWQVELWTIENAPAHPNLDSSEGGCLCPTNIKPQVSQQRF
ncbi:MAG: hypothetical protein JRJ79_06420 [Deltaproteobacteria bacterium]|nr:hypothetical protein [Deltaproteobacteria bacterium]